MASDQARALSFGSANYEQFLHLSEWYICISKSLQETRFYASRIHEFKNGKIKGGGGGGGDEQSAKKDVRITYFSWRKVHFNLFIA